LAPVLPGFRQQLFSLAKDWMLLFLKKTINPGAEPDSYQKEVLGLIWGQAGIGCQMCSIGILKNLAKKRRDYYKLTRLDPSYTVVFGKDEFLDIPANYVELRKTFESLESGSAAKLDVFLKEAAYKYEVGINNLVYKPSRTIREFISLRLLIDVIRMDVFRSFQSHIEKFFKNKRILQLLEFPILFLGALAKNTPALYSLMNYADIKLGTWYPEGGMKAVVDGMVELAREQGVKIELSTVVTGFEYEKRRISAVRTQGKSYQADVVVAGADYHHVEAELLVPKYRSYTDKYWNSRLLAPSSLLFYLGFDRRIEGINHHTLFFDEPFHPHAEAIYTTKEVARKTTILRKCTQQDR
jgi:phytoene desaturase